VLKAEIKAGTEYALRERRVAGTPFQRVRVIDHIRRNKWKVEWIDPNPGLIDYVESVQLIVPWKERRDFLKDEENEERLRRHNEQHGYDRVSSPIAIALGHVFQSTGEEVCFYRGTLTGSPDAVSRLKTRAGVAAARQSPAVYVDRQGILHLPFDEVIELARRFCGAEPAAVLVGAEATERRWMRKASHGEDHIISLLNGHRAAWALVRQWAGHDAAIALREAEIRRLERLLWDAVYALQKAGLDSDAARLRQAIEKG